MRIISRIMKYGIVFALGYYIGAGGCSDYLKEKSNNLEKKVAEEYYGGFGKNSK